MLTSSIFALVVSTLPYQGAATCADVLFKNPEVQDAYIMGAANATRMFMPYDDQRMFRANVIVRELRVQAEATCRKDHSEVYLHVFTASVFQMRYRMKAEYFLLYWDFLARTEGVNTFLEAIRITEERMQSDPHAVRVVILKEIFKGAR